MRRVLFLLGVCFSAGLLLRCGSSSSSTANASASGVAKRAFVTQDVSSSLSAAGVLLIDAANDVLVLKSAISAGIRPGMMVVTPNRSATLVFSDQENLLTILSNSSEASAATVTLPGFTESFLVSPDSQIGYAAVPGGFVSGQPPGMVKAFSMLNGGFTAEIDIPAVRFLAMNHSGSRILAFSTGLDAVANTVSVINVNGAINPTVTQVPGFDHPVAAFFSSDDSVAYVVNCGPECGGVQASVQKLHLTTNVPGTPVMVPASSVALVNGTTMYLAGTPFDRLSQSEVQPCTGQTTQAQFCGLLTILDLPSMTVTKSGIVITDGYHNRIAMGANGQLFVGARTCIQINVLSEVRGCLSVYNTQTGAVVIPPDGGNVTGIQPIAGRDVVYVTQNGELRIYDTTTDKLQTKQLDLTGEAVDVKTVDF